MASIERLQNESIERMISRFRRIMMRDGALKEARTRLFFKKDETRREQKIRAIYREEKRREAAMAAV